MATLGRARDRHTGEKLTLKLSSDERQQGTYVIGTPGTGKTTMLKNIAVEDMWHYPDEGLCVLDPHGDLTDELLGWVPPKRVNDVVYLNPMELEHPFGLNLLEYDRDSPNSEHEKRWVVSTILETLHRLFWYSWGPRLEHVLQHTIRTALKVPDSTFIELLLLLTAKDYRETVIGTEDSVKAGDYGQLNYKDDYLLVKYWYDWFLKLRNQQTEVTSSTINKLSPFLLDSMMRNIIGQAKSSIKLLDIMDEGKILFVNLSKGDLGENNSALLGSVLVNLILIAALRRRGEKYQREGRKQFHVIVDEYQNFANPSFSILQSEARKFGVDLIVAHQYRDQLDQDSRGASLNVGNVVCFRVSGRDSYMLASQFDNSPPPAETKMEPAYGPWKDAPAGYELYAQYRSPGSDEPIYEEVEMPRRAYSDVEAEMANKLSTLKDYHAYSRLIRKPAPGQSELKEYYLATDKLPRVDAKWSAEIRQACIEHSMEKYCSDRETVEEEIYRRTGGRITTDTMPPAMEYTDM